MNFEITKEQWEKMPEDVRLRVLLKLEDHALSMYQAPLKGFVPNGAIEKLIDAIGKWDPDKPDEQQWIFIVPASNSLGKTAAALAIIGNIVWGPQNKWFDRPRFRDWPYPDKNFWYISEHTAFKEFICGTHQHQKTEIKKWFPKGRYTFEKMGQEYFSFLTTDTGWSGTFKTFNQATTKFEATKISVAVFDEPPPEPLLDAVVARMTAGGIIIFVMTPMFHSAWVKDRLVDKASAGTKTFVLFSDIESNCKQHGVRGRLSHGRIRQVVETWPAEQREAREKGLFMHMSGIIIRGLHPAVNRHELPGSAFSQNTVDRDEEKAGKMVGPCTIYNVIDPHDARPPFIAWFAVDRFENAYAVGEFPPLDRYGPFHLIKTFDLTTEQICIEMMNFEKMQGWDPTSIIRIMDPNSGMRPLRDVGIRTWEMYGRIGNKLGYPFNYTLNVSDDRPSGHQLIRDWAHIDANNETRFKIGHSCPQLWHQLNNYSGDPRIGKSLEKHGAGERVSEKYKESKV